MEYIEHPWINKNSIEKRSYQEDISRVAATGNTLVVLPTGIGKTPIAVILAAERLNQAFKQKKDAKILVMAPTKPLVAQHQKSFEKFLKLGPSELVMVTGSVKPEERERLYKQAEIIFSTPQTIRNDIKTKRLDLSDIWLLVVDEAHRAVKNYAYTSVSESYMKQSNNPLILALTASPGGDRKKINEVKDRLSIKNVEIRTREDEDVLPHIQEVKYERVEVELIDELKQVRLLLEAIKQKRFDQLIEWHFVHSRMMSKVQILMMQQELAKKKQGTSFLAMSFLAEILKLDHALILLETQSVYSLKCYLDSMKKDAEAKATKAVIRLVQEKEFIQASKIVDELDEKDIEHPKIEKLLEIIREQFSSDKDSRIIIFSQYRDTVNKIFRTLKTLPDVKPIEFIGQAKKRGKGLSQKEQVNIVNEFKQGYYNVLCSSSIGEEGLDITETNLVVFYEPVPSGIRKIQRAGRTARTQAGRVIVMLTKNTRDQAFYWSGYHKERKMHKIVKSMQEKSLLDFA